MEQATAKIKINQKLPDGTINKYEGDIELETIKEILGDQNAKITIGSSQSDKDFGNGVETFMSVTLTCDQNSKDIDIAMGLASTIIHKRLTSLHSEGIAEWARNRELNKELMKG